MVNEAGKAEPDKVRRGQRVTKDIINEIRRGLTKQIVGSGIDVQAGAGNVTLSRRKGQKHPAPDRQIVTITEDIGEGVYAWTKDKGNGPGSGEATELSELEGIDVDTKVVIFKHQGKWWFQIASPGAMACKVVSKVTGSTYSVIEVDPPNTTTVKEDAEAFEAKETNASVDVDNGTRVFVHSIGGLFWFSYPVKAC